MFAARETLRGIEQTVLLNAATAYMNLLRDAGILELQRTNLDVLTEQLRQTKARLESGNVTATDVSQSEARLNVGRTQLFAAEANYASSRAAYRQVIGLDPGRLAPAAPVDRFSPHTLPAAMAAGIAQNPAVTTAQHNVDIAIHQVKVAEGALYPTLSLQGSVQKNYEQTLNPLQSFTRRGQRCNTPRRSIRAAPNTPRSARPRRRKGQKQLDLSVARDQARMAVAQAWAQLEAAKSSIESTKNQVKAAEAALNGVREEARLGQRTTLDVLNAQQELVNARIAMVVAQRDRLVNSYALLAAVGRLAPAGARPQRRRPTTRRCTTTRSATPGSACERRTGGSRYLGALAARRPAGDELRHDARCRADVLRANVRRASRSIADIRRSAGLYGVRWPVCGPASPAAGIRLNIGRTRRSKTARADPSADIRSNAPPRSRALTTKAADWFRLAGASALPPRFPQAQPVVSNALFSYG